MSQKNVKKLKIYLKNENPDPVIIEFFKKSNPISTEKALKWLNRKVKKNG